MCHSKLSGLHAFDNMEFVEDLKATFKKSKNRNKHIIICSDFNYDLFEYEHNGHINGFLNNISSNLLQPRIMKPKRIVKYNRPSLVDYIFVNIYDKENHSGNIIDKITDISQILVLSEIWEISYKNKNLKLEIYENFWQNTSVISNN